MRFFYFLALVTAFTQAATPSTLPCNNLNSRLKPLCDKAPASERVAYEKINCVSSCRDDACKSNCQSSAMKELVKLDKPVISLEECLFQCKNDN